jgi:hypothetical protein
MEARARGSSRRHDLEHATYVSDGASRSSLLRYFQEPRVDLLERRAPAIAGVTAHYLDHRFDLLGSGWVQVRHGMTCTGVEGRRFPSTTEIEPDADGAWLRSRVTDPNFEEARRIWRLVDPGYQPIDWHLDFKSGWRWQERTWHKDVVFGDLPGVDVKVPWELARMQHLPQLAIAAALARAGTSDFLPIERYVREFRNQVLDFIATNPPRFGVNWRTTMDVAIRIANWLVAFDLFRASSVAFDPAFEAVFARSAFEHGRHIVENLEWHEKDRGNHYLANIVGLTFVAAFLPRDPEVDAWLAFAVEETLAEASTQFLDDGTNIEASTSYHRLSAEMLAYGAALVLGLGPDKVTALQHHDDRRLTRESGSRLTRVELPRSVDGSIASLPTWLSTRLERAAEFSVDLTKPDGRVPQVGDNDSSRFLKVVPVVQAVPVAEMRRRFANLDGYAGLPDKSTYWAEVHLDHRPVVAAINGLFGRLDLAAFVGDHGFESSVVRDIAQRVALPSYRLDGPSQAESITIGGSPALAEVDRWLADRPPIQRRTVLIHLEIGGAIDGLRLLAYPDFGLYVMRSRRAYVAIRCGQVRGPRGAHAHNDQFSIELNVDGKDWIRDPGTYLYTALPDRRNAYRSSRAHFTPRLAAEPARLDRGLFVLEPRSKATCLYWGPEGFAGEQRSADRRLLYRLRLEDNRVVITYGADGWALSPSVDTGDAWRDLLPSVPFSPGYGIVEQAV